MATTFNYLFPDEIIFKILSLLPVISLLRCKSVCKLWLSIITNPQFIQTHLNISNTEQPSLLNLASVVGFNVLLRNEQDSIPLAFLQSRQHSSRIQLPPQFNTATRFIGYCNGLVCFCDYISELFCVWNPSTKRFKMLPTPNKKTDGTPFKLGFGYDSVSCDYKIVRILVSSVSHMVEGELYSVSDDCWKDIEVPSAVQKAWPFMNCIPLLPINGALYLVDVRVLVSFDLHNEVFQVYPYPDSVKDIRNLTSLVFEGSVAMIFKTAVGDGSVHSLWTLDDVCGEVCWTKKFDLEPELEIDRVDLYLGGGRLIALDFRVPRYFVYDLMKKETRTLLLSVDDEMVLSLLSVDEEMVLSAVKYTESLVSLPGFQQVE